MDCEGLPQRIAESLHNHGIWTRDDLIQNQRGALAALQSAYMIDVATLVQLAAKEG